MLLNATRANQGISRLANIAKKGVINMKNKKNNEPPPVILCLTICLLVAVAFAGCVSGNDSNSSSDLNKDNLPEACCNLCGVGCAPVQDYNHTLPVQTYPGGG